MRVIAGEFRSRRLLSIPGDATRPTADRVREALFNILQTRISGASFVDAYAGTGAVGIEALSRGAEHCVFVEKHPRCVEAIRANLANTHLVERATVVRGPVEREWRGVCQAHGPFDILFADPPYNLAGFAGLIEGILQTWEGVAEDGVIVVQCSAELAPGGTQPTRVKRFGESEMRWYERG